jgi:hypothetical protein
MYARIPEDEPVFTLRGKDLLALGAIDEWLRLAHLAGVNEDKIRRGVEHLQDIRQFQANHRERCQIPD